MSLRTKFLVSFLTISAALTIATLVAVSYTVRNRTRAGVLTDLHTSLETYDTFSQQRDDTLNRSARMLANLPNVRALMTTQDTATVQDASADIWRQSGSDLLALGEPAGNVLGIQTRGSRLTANVAQELLKSTLSQGTSRDWWFGNGHLYQVWIQPIYLGSEAQGDVLGILILGDEIDSQSAQLFRNITASEVVFTSGQTVVASTLDSSLQSQLVPQLPLLSPGSQSLAFDIHVGKEQYLATTVALMPGSGSQVSITVLKSLDKATEFLSELNHVLIALGMLTLLAGSMIAFHLSRSIARPLDNLVAGVRALDAGDFSYPLNHTGGDEVAEVTGAFDRMRANLQKTMSEQQQLEKRLRQAHKMEAIGRLAGGVAHDFNNLLTIIRGHSDILLERVSATPSHRHSVEQIQGAANRAVSMTRQLLAFSRMQVLEPRILDLNVVVGDLGKMLPRLIGEHIEYQFQPDAKATMVTADPGQIEQVILNLVVNARDAMPQGGAITVRTHAVELDQTEAEKRPPMTPGKYVLLSVSDTGQGIDDKTKALIFEPFFTTKEVGKGTGLGLATVYGVVKQSGGFIWVESALGKGSTFEIYLPQAQGKAAQAEAAPKSSVASRHNETILVVEDESGVRELACEFLRVSGYHALSAKDGLDAMEVAARHNGTIDLVLSDIVMPRMNGYEFAQRLAAVRPDTKFVFMSGYSEYAGADAPPTHPHTILQKPFSVSSLAEKIREELDRPKTNQSEAVREHSVS